MFQVNARRLDEKIGEICAALGYEDVSAWDPVHSPGEAYMVIEHAIKTRVITGPRQWRLEFDYNWDEDGGGYRWRLLPADLAIGTSLTSRWSGVRWLGGGCTGVLAARSIICLAVDEANLMLRELPQLQSPRQSMAGTWLLAACALFAGVGIGAYAMSILWR